jgi:hypothetical protein
VSTLYAVKKPLWHRISRKDFQPGEEIDLSHLTPEEIESLKAGGHITELATPVPQGASSRRPTRRPSEPALEEGDNSNG